ncbi:uncharacterized protein LOC125690810 [Lagopus muta]|uniref:uncharacterized protein LOC125690810 n=1 Tax=Lagopus muta TaxID=64668 RepID=UPI00209DC489|nr:uncharacterized protein LOC125690810 [Lagopus muta]
MRKVTFRGRFWGPHGCCPHPPPPQERRSCGLCHCPKMPSGQQGWRSCCSASPTVSPTWRWPPSGDQSPLGVTKLCNFLRQERCAVTHLTVAGNHLDGSDVTELMGAAMFRGRVRSLDASANGAVSAASLRSLQAMLAGRPHALRHLNLAGCSLQLPPDDAVWEQLGAAVEELRIRGAARRGGQKWGGGEGRGAERWGAVMGGATRYVKAWGYHDMGMSRYGDRVTWGFHDTEMS